MAASAAGSDAETARRSDRPINTRSIVTIATSRTQSTDRPMPHPRPARIFAPLPTSAPAT